MNKKKGIIIGVVAIVIIAIVIGVYFLINGTRNRILPIKEKVSTIILDINPSMEIKLNKDEEVISVRPLNDDAKDVINNDLVGKKIDDVITLITDAVIEKGYAKDNEITILMSSTGDVNVTNVESAIISSFTEKGITAKVIVPEISDTAKELAEEYNISEGKASYIEEIIKENSDLKLEDLKDKTIGELETIKNKEEEPAKEDEKATTPETNIGTTTTKSNSSSGSSSSGSKSNTKQPSDPTKDLDAWCAYNSNGNPYGHEKPMMLNTNDFMSKIEAYVMEKYNVASTDDFINRGFTTTQKDNRSSYCVAYVTTYVTRDWYKTFIIDSVKGNIIDETTKSVPKLLTDMEARDIALKEFNIIADDCWDYAPGEARLTMDGMGGSNEYYRYSVVLSLKNGEMHYVTINAQTGKVLSAN